MKFERKIKAQDLFIKHNSYFGKGQSFVYQAKTVFQILFYPSATYVAWTGNKPSLYLLGICFFLYVGFFWWLGYYLDKIGYFHREAEFGNKRNPVMKQIRDKLNIKEDLERDNKT